MTPLTEAPMTDELGRIVEYRVSWKREGRRRKSVTFKSRVAAERRSNRVANETDDDLHWMCDEGHGIYGQGPDAERTCMPPVIEGPVIEERHVGPWSALEAPAHAGEEAGDAD